VVKSDRPVAIAAPLAIRGETALGGGPQNEWLRRSTMAAAVTSGAMIAQQVAGKAVRDAFFLTHFAPALLPRVMALAAIVSLGAIVLLSRLLGRHTPRRVMPILFAVSGAGLALEWALGRWSPGVAAVAVYLHVTVFSPIVMTCFWSLINENFDPHTARAAVARIAGGGTWGGVLGGIAAWRGSKVMSPENAVLMIAFINVACVAGTLWIRSPERRPADADAHQISAVSALRKAPFLRNLALLVLVGAAISSLLDYVFSAQAATAFGHGPELLSFFGFFGLCVSVTSLLLQVSLGRVAMEKAGLAVNIGVLPGIILLGSAIGMAMPGLLSAGLLRGAEMVQRNTLFRSAYELLYTPLPEARKRATKALIDVGFDRMGTVLGSSITMIVLFVSSHDVHEQRYLLAFVVVLALFTFPLVRALHRGYVGALEQGLREGARMLRLLPADPQGAFVADMKERTRDRLIERVERLRRHHDDRGPAHDALMRGRALAHLVADLCSNDVARARAALAGWDERHRALASFAITLLAQPALHVEARAALRGIARRVTGQLVDALVDPTMEFSVRRRIPAVIADAGTQRAADGLVLGLDDERFEVRFAAGRALLRLASAQPDIAIPRAVIVEKIRTEALRAPSPPSADAADEPEADGDATQTLLQVIAIDRVSRTVELLFTLLALITDREPLRHCFRALQAEDLRQRGTALEYLHATLPGEILEAVWPLLAEGGPLPAPRAAAEALKELLEAAQGPLSKPPPDSASQKIPPSPRPAPPS
jgi:hypothetical protein